MSDDLPALATISGLQGPVDKTSWTAPTYLYHYGYCYMTPGVNHCLVYAKAADVSQSSTSQPKAYNGSLTQTLPSGVLSTDRISFAPESIYENTTATDDASNLAGYLNAIAGVTVNATGWKDSTDPNLSLLYDNFTNHGNDLPGSAANVKAWMGALKKALTDLSYEEDSEGYSLRDAIVGEINNQLANLEETIYPRNLCLPDGAAVLRWTTTTMGEGFQPQLQTTTIDNINSVSRFAYPAALYYYGDSHLKSTSQEVKFTSIYTSANTWDDVLNHFPNSTINGTTKAAVLVEPVQYGVAQLQVSVSASSATLQDATPENISIGTNKFPLTGIIVCGQREVGYDFVPRDNSDANVKFIYDSKVTSDRYLTTTSSPVTTTLVLQSYDGEDVDIILEFQNDSGQRFKGIDGYVYPGTRFYLIGRVNASAYDKKTGDETSRGRVFTKDYTTAVNMKVVSLAKAYNVLPNILSSNLEIGVETTPKWIAAEPDNVKLY